MTFSSCIKLIPLNGSKKVIHLSRFISMDKVMPNRAKWLVTRKGRGLNCRISYRYRDEKFKSWLISMNQEVLLGLELLFKSITPRMV